MIELRPQKGPQEAFLASPADIVIYGGGAGGGKSWSLVFEPVRHLESHGVSAVCFRRELAQVKVPGGLWDEASSMYPPLGGYPRESILDWVFPDGLKVKFSGLEQERDVYKYQGSQIPILLFDELTHFTVRQFFYMLSRNRSVTGIPGYVRATCNPDPNSWVKPFIQWWIDPITGLAIPERSGVIRYFIREVDTIVWGDSAGELIEKYGKTNIPKSVTFIYATLFDNKILLDKDPSYLANLKALPLVDRERLLGGNWNTVESAGMFFKKTYFEVINAVPSNIVKRVRAWDRAATKVDESNKDKIDPDYTVGLLMGKTRSNIFIVLDVIRVRESPHKVNEIILNTAKQDGVGIEIKLFQDPGSAGVFEAETMKKILAGFIIKIEKIVTNKVVAAKPVSAQSEAGNIKLFKASWNDSFFGEVENFPDGKHDDQVDAFSSAFNHLTAGNVGSLTEDYLTNMGFKDESLSW